MKSRLIIVLITLWLLGACSPSTDLTPLVVDTVPAPSFTPSQTSPPTETLQPPTATASPEPVGGVTLWQVNVRSGPGVYYDQIGQINQNQPVQITGQDPSKEWVAIRYPDGPKGLGWVTSEYIAVENGVNLPVLGLVTLANGTPAPQARLIQKLNVRNGPGTHYDPVGILPVDSIVWLIGRNQAGSWLLIDYPNSPSSSGWIIAGYVQYQDVLSLPMFDPSGNPLGDNSATQSDITLPTPTPIVVPAYKDGDSAEDPGTFQVFSPLGIDRFSFSSDLSTPDGDPLDWIGFRPYSPRKGDPSNLSASLICTGQGVIQVQLWQGGKPLDHWGELNCGDVNNTLILKGGMDYLFRLQIADAPSLQVASFTLTLSIKP